MFKFKRNKKKNKVKIKNMMEYYKSYNAHMEMVFKSGGGFLGTLCKAEEELENYKFFIEYCENLIANQNKEIKLMEKKIVELSTTYEFKDTAIYIKINYSLLKEKLNKKYIWYLFLFIYKTFFSLLFLLINDSSS